jgi:DnaJ-class molecular chaperone
VIHVREHLTFKRDGANLMMEQDITFADAALGGEIKDGKTIIGLLLAERRLRGKKGFV